MLNTENKFSFLSCSCLSAVSEIICNYQSRVLVNSSLSKMWTAVMENDFLNSYDTLTNQRMTITKMKVCLSSLWGETYNLFLNLCMVSLGCLVGFSFVCSVYYEK